MIVRDLARAAGNSHDLIIVGGGIHGAALALESVRRGLRPLLLEAGDFGGGASGSSLRIVHGGLRYLQSMDVARFRESVRERRIIATRFPHLVRLLPCLMPLYGVGLKRRPVLRAALSLNDLLSLDRNWGVEAQHSLPFGQILSRMETTARFPLVRRQGLQGAALWYDYFMRSSERILIETLRAACEQGAQAANYVMVERLRVDGGRVAGVVARDEESGERLEISAPLVINCTGQRCGDFAAAQGAGMDGMFHPSLAFNVLLNLPPPADCAVAVSAPHPGAPVYFIVPFGRKVLAGTVHRPRPPGTLDANPTDEEIESFLADLRGAVPGWDVRLHDVLRVFAGLLPVRAAGSTDLTTREAITNHASAGGPDGFFSVAGIKFTTARAVAERTLRCALGVLPPESYPVTFHDNHRRITPPLLLNAALLDAAEPANVRATLDKVIAEEAVRAPEDLILRRTNWSLGTADLSRLRSRVEAMLAPSRASASNAAASGA